MNLEFSKNNLKQQFIEIQQQEMSIAKELEEKYARETTPEILKKAVA